MIKKIVVLAALALTSACAHGGAIAFPEEIKTPIWTHVDWQFTGCRKGQCMSKVTMNTVVSREMCHAAAHDAMCTFLDEREYCNKGGFIPSKLVHSGVEYNLNVWGVQEGQTVCYLKTLFTAESKEELNSP